MSSYDTIDDDGMTAAPDAFAKVPPITGDRSWTDDRERFARAHHRPYREPVVLVPSIVRHAQAIAGRRRRRSSSTWSMTPARRIDTGPQASAMDHRPSWWRRG